MPNQTSPIPAIVEGTNAVRKINEYFDAGGTAMTGGRNAAGITGPLKFAVFGGRAGGVDGGNTEVTLTASATNYLVWKKSDGAISASTSTTNWNDFTNYWRLYSVVAGVGSATDYTDERLSAEGIFGGGGGGSGVASVNGQTGVVALDSDDVPEGASNLYLTTERVQDIVGAFVVAGANMTITYSDALNTLTFAAAGGGGGGGMTNPMTTVGDVIYGTTAGAPARLGAGSDGQVLTLVSGVPAWVSASGGGFTGGALTSALDEAKGADIVRAATTNIAAAAGNFVHLTGTTTITALGTAQAGARRGVRFAAAGTLTHNATSLVLPGAANITTAANDIAEFISEGSGNWRCTTYTRASGQSVVAPTAGASLTNFTGALNTAAPNGTVNAARLLVTGGTSNVDMVLTPKGTGAFQLHLADGTATGGDKRGSQAVDMQLIRALSSQVASGQGAFTAGANNTASSTSAIAMGQTNIASNSYSSAIGGDENTASGFSAATLGGSRNDASSTRSVVLAGRFVRTTTAGMVGFGAHASALGQSCGALYALGKSSFNATPVILTTDAGVEASDNQIALRSTSAVIVTGRALGYDSATGNTKSWTFVAHLKRDASLASTSVVASSVTVIGTSAGAASWALALMADTANGCLSLRVTGAASTTIAWAASAEAVDVS